MTLIIETGTGSATAQAWADLPAYEAWLLLVFGETFAGTDAAGEAAILRAVSYMQALEWNGTRVYGRQQALAWPRVGVYDKDGWYVETDSIPIEVIEAQHILTRAEVATPGTLAPSVTLAGGKTLIGIDSLTWETRKAPVTVEASRPVVTMAMDRLKGLIRTGGTTMLMRA